MKDAYYFPHDSNAKQDPKILAMLSVYGMTGYGWYWAIIEMLREQGNYRIDISGKFSYNALAMQMLCDAETAQKFIADCINEFKLFVSDGNYFWSESLVRRMKNWEEKSEKARQSALKRWGKSSDANAMQTHTEGNAIKVKESKEEESKEDTPSVVSPTAENPALEIQHALQKAGILMPSGFEVEKLIKWYEEGMDLDLIVMAIEKAALAGQRKVNYINGILKDLNQQGITTLDQAQAAEAEFEQSKGRKKERAPANKDPAKFNGIYMS